MWPVRLLFVAMYPLLLAVLLLTADTSSGAWASVVEARRLSSCGSRALEGSSVVVACGLSCSVTCGIFPDQGSNPCPLLWQEDS